VGTGVVAAAATVFGRATATAVVRATSGALATDRLGTGLSADDGEGAPLARPIPIIATGSDASSRRSVLMPSVG